nr:hypothetical protein [Bradyrhizobium symbiodeficiens]
MVLQQIAGLDRGLVAAVDQDDSAALQLDHFHGRGDFSRGSQQRGHLRPRALGVIGPSGGLADVGKLYRIRTIIFGGDLRKQRRLPCAGDCKRTIVGCDYSKSPKLGTAELRRGRYFAVAAAADRIGIERHRSFAGADQ